MIATSSEQSDQSEENSESESASDDKDDEKSETNKETLNEDNFSNNLNRLPQVQEKSEQQITTASDSISAENPLQANLTDTNLSLEFKYSKNYLIFSIYSFLENR